MQNTDSVIAPETRVIKTFESGDTIVQLRNVQAVNEIFANHGPSRRMLFGYEGQETCEPYIFYALQGADGQSKATFTQTEDKRITHCHGALGSGVPHENDLPLLAVYIEENKLKPEVPLQNAGVVLWEGAYYNPYNLPENVVLQGDNDFTAFKKPLTIPQHMTAQSLQISGEQYDPKAHWNVYAKNWNITQSITYVWKNDKDALHRDGAPALIRLGKGAMSPLPNSPAFMTVGEDDKGSILLEWHQNGQLHSNDTPARVGFTHADAVKGLFDPLSDDDDFDINAEIASRISGVPAPQSKDENVSETWMRHGRPYNESSNERFNWAVKRNKTILGYVF